MFAALHQGLDLGAKIFDAGHEIIEGQQHAAETGDFRHVVEHGGDFGVGPDQGAHVEIDRRGRVRELADIGIAAGFGVGGALFGEPGERAFVLAGFIKFPFRGGGGIGGICNDHHQRVARDVAASVRGDCLHAGDGGRDGFGRVNPHAEAEIIVGLGGGEAHAGGALPGADDFDIGLGARADMAIVHLEELALEVRSPGCP